MSSISLCIPDFITALQQKTVGMLGVVGPGLGLRTGTTAGFARAMVSQGAGSSKREVVEMAAVTEAMTGSS